MSSRRDPMQEAIADPLPRLREQLATEFGAVVPGEKIEQAAQQALGEFEDARVREFVSVLAWRRARARLRQATSATR